MKWIELKTGWCLNSRVILKSNLVLLITLEFRHQPVLYSIHFTIYTWLPNCGKFEKNPMNVQKIKGILLWLHWHRPWKMLILQYILSFWRKIIPSTHCTGLKPYVTQKYRMQGPLIFDENSFIQRNKLLVFVLSTNFASLFWRKGF